MFALLLLLLLFVTKSE